MAISEEDKKKLVTLERLAYFKTRLDQLYDQLYVKMVEGSRLITEEEAAAIGQMPEVSMATESDIDLIFDEADAGTGDDTVSGGTNDDTVPAGTGNDTVTGG